jgi:hypothetical protein
MAAMLSEEPRHGGGFGSRGQQWGSHHEPTVLDWGMACYAGSCGGRCAVGLSMACKRSAGEAGALGFLGT